MRTFGLSFLAVIIQPHASWLSEKPSCTKILLTFPMRPRVALNYSVKNIWNDVCQIIYTYICSAQSDNLRNLEIALCILRIPRLRSNLEIAQPISRLRSQSQDCITHTRNLKIAWFACTTNYNLCQYNWQWAIHCACVARRMEDSLDKASIGSLLRSGRVSNAVCW